MFFALFHPFLLFLTSTVTYDTLTRMNIRHNRQDKNVRINAS
jgi:hypothetical protein